MKNLTDIFTSKIYQGDRDFHTAQPFPMTVIDNFLPETTALNMFNELQSIDESIWRTFTRNGSHMIELNKLHQTPIAFELTGYLHSASSMSQLSALTGIPGLIPDPYLVGAGYSKSFAGDTLKIHTDFNWNDTLKLHRAASMIIYLTPDWDPNWNGGLDFYDKERQNVITHVDCLFNRCIIWKYDKFGWHGHTKPLTCPPNRPRTTFRLFFYTSNSTFLEDDPPHRSQYWYDAETKRAYDKREEL